jgi:hypothetical protein
VTITLVKEESEDVHSERIRAAPSVPTYHNFSLLLSVVLPAILLFLDLLALFPGSKWSSSPAIDSSCMAARISDD